MINNKKMKKIGIALGSGSSRGWAHIGVLKALKEEDIQIDYIAGTSIGALIGAVYATGNIDSFEDFTRKITWKTVLSYLDVIIPKNGLISGKKIYKLLSEYFGTKTIESLKISYCCTAVDINTGKEIRFKSGSIVNAVRASISIPGIFNPFSYKGKYLVDGGILNPLPVNIVRQMGADIVIAVNLNHQQVNTSKKKHDNSTGKKDKILSGKIDINKDRNNQIIQIFEKKYKTIRKSIQSKYKGLVSWKNAPNILDIMGNTTYIIQDMIAKNNLILFKPDILIQPALGHLKLLDFDQAEATIDEGYKKTKQVVGDLKKI